MHPSETWRTWGGGTLADVKCFVPFEFFEERGVEQDPLTWGPSGVKLPSTLVDAGPAQRLTVHLPMVRVVSR